MGSCVDKQVYFREGHGHTENAISADKVLRCRNWKKVDKPFVVDTGMGYNYYFTPAENNSPDLWST